MAMKLGNLENNNFLFGEVNYCKPASGEDIGHCVDAWLGNIPLAWRKRRISIKKWGDISIRYKLEITGTKTEAQKMLDGECWAIFYFFQFTDAIVICKVDDIITCLQDKKFITKLNPDSGRTWGAYIKLADIPHLIQYL